MNDIQTAISDACDHLIQIVFENDIEERVRHELLDLLRNLQAAFKK